MKFFSDDPMTATAFEHYAMAAWFVAWDIILILVVTGVIR
jgi:hypothetical protein